jgi:hypothetical protein
MIARNPGVTMRQIFCATGLSVTLALLACPAAASVVGSCKFDTDKLAYAGDPLDQARCLLRPVAKWGKVSATPAVLPPTLANVIGKAPTLAKSKLATYLAQKGLADPKLDGPVSRARGGSASAPLARYFVIHDTSSPWIGNEAFPGDIDMAKRFNNVQGYLGPNAVAHGFVGRNGAVGIGHDFAVPWRATKFETKVVGAPAKGLFLHIENLQPRRRDPAGGAKNDAIAPKPGLTSAQYDRLAQLYAVASLRAGAWLVPAYHTVIDEGISDGHDDPQNFELDKFDAALARLIQAVEAQP